MDTPDIVINPNPLNSKLASKLPPKILLMVPILLVIALIGWLIFTKTQKSSPAQTFSVTRFDSKIVQVMKPGDTLTGKGIPSAKISLSITPDGTRADVTMDKNGLWSYTIPKNLKPKNYHLTITVLDVKDNIASIKSYNIKLE